LGGQRKRAFSRSSAPLQRFRAARSRRFEASEQRAAERRATRVMKELPALTRHRTWCRERLADSLPPRRQPRVTPTIVPKREQLLEHPSATLVSEACKAEFPAAKGGFLRLAAGRGRRPFDPQVETSNNGFLRVSWNEKRAEAPSSSDLTRRNLGRVRGPVRTIATRRFRGLSRSASARSANTEEATARVKAVSLGPPSRGPIEE
jgi:hypothetical protein